MEIRRSLVAACSPELLFSWVDDLARYPEWMRLVHEVTPSSETVEDLPAWDVELRAQVGPFARSKRLRMVRTEHDAPRRVTFERAEIDGRTHSPWVLSASIEPAVAKPPSRTNDVESTGLTMELHYGGGLWTGVVLQRVLDDEVRRGSDALTELVTNAPTR